MPFLGIFSKKGKGKEKDGDRSSSMRSGASDAGSAISSPSAEFIPVEKPLAYSHNGEPSLHPNDAAPGSRLYPSVAAASSTDKLRLPFRKKKYNGSAASAMSSGSNLLAPPRPSFLSRGNPGTSSDPDVPRLGLPPSRSDVFGDSQNAASTRSLPNDKPSRTGPASLPSATPKAPANKRPPLFPWPKSTPTTPTSTAKAKAADETDDNSFNLKSFRHIRPTSPSSITPNGSNVSLTVPSPSGGPIPRPRPRGASGASEAQRISVAAFREAQARRSQAGSPVPSFRSPSPHGIPTPNYGDSRSESPRGRPSQRPAPQAMRSVSQNQPTGRSNNMYANTSDEEDDSEEEDESSDDGFGDGHKSNLSRRRTVTQRRKTDELDVRATRSELSHGSPTSPPRNVGPSSTKRAARSNSNVNTDEQKSKVAVPVPTKAATAPGVLSGTRQNSTTAFPSSQPRTSSSDSEDDTPLATLVPPRRPGSALSSASNSSSVGRPKPLLDINEITKRPPQFGPTSAEAVKPKATDVAFTKGSTLLSSPPQPAARNPRKSLPPAPIDLPEAVHDRVISKAPPNGKFISPPGSPTRGNTVERHVGTTTPGSPTASSTGTAASGFTTQRKSPMRKETAETSTSSGSQPEERGSREGLGERLNRAAKSTDRLPKSVSPPSDRDMGVKTPQQQQPATGEDQEEEETLKARRPGHRRGHSDEYSRSPATAPRRPVPVKTPEPAPSIDPTEDLASVLGAGIRLISRNGEEPETDSDETSLSSSCDDDGKVPQVAPFMPPIPIQRRTPAPSFSVTSRPQHVRGSLSVSAGLSDQNLTSSVTASPVSPSPVSTTPTGRQRSSTLFTSPPPSFTPPPRSQESPKVPPMFSSKETSRPNTERPQPLKAATMDPRRDQPQRPPLNSSFTAPSPSRHARQRSSGTVVPPIPPPPMRPFASPRDSPASSTGDSSSGRAPLTPRDDSDQDSGLGASGSSRVRIRGREDDDNSSSQWSGGVSGLKLHTKGKPSKDRRISFDESAKGKEKIKVKETPEEEETRRRERRRTEAKAAIELGNVINGKGPIVDDDDDEDQPISKTRAGLMNAMNIGPMMTGHQMPLMPFNSSPSGMGWNSGMGMGMNMNMNMQPWPQMQQNLLSPAQFMVPAPSDPSMIAAHQQAMMYAKQAYQMAVAQQAMAAAGEEWERGSSVGFGGGSVYGGGSSASMMNGMVGQGWSTSSMIFPSQSRTSMFSGAQSEYGGPTRSSMGTWGSSQSVFGENERSRRMSGMSGMPPSRQSGMYPPPPPIPASKSSSNSPSPTRGGGSRPRTISQPAAVVQQNRAPGMRRAAPPSSWKAAN